LQQSQETQNKSKETVTLQINQSLQSTLLNVILLNVMVPSLLLKMLEAFIRYSLGNNAIVTLIKQIRGCIFSHV
jgi:hypothetical protein